MWYQKIVQIFKTEDLRKKIFYISGILVVFRLMANIPIPGVDVENLRRFFGQFPIFSLYNMFSGGALQRFSIVMLGVGPYITAVIILQLLTMIFPQLEKMYREEGEAGRQKFNQYGRLLTLPLAMLQGYGMLFLLQRQNVVSGLSPFNLFIAILTMTAGTLFLMWLGELISEKGIGDGVSLLIFAGIVAEFPTNIQQMVVEIQMAPEKMLQYLLFFGAALLIIAGVVLITEARRNIPVSYAKRVRGNKMYGGVSTYLPLSVNPAGVMPIIFAISILLFPGMLASFLSGVAGILGKVSLVVANFFDPQKNPWGHGILYFLLVCLFTYFYTAVTFDPEDIAENLQKMGGFIPGIRPGESTAKFLYYILNRVLLVGALFLGTIAIMPSIIRGVTGVASFHFLIGGTSLLIVVSVVLETMRQIEAQLQMREYETF